MNPFERLVILGRQVGGWLPKQSVAVSPHIASAPWWWIPAWSMGVFVAEVGVLNLIVPVSTLGLPLFLVNMWLCFVGGGVAGFWIGKRRGYHPPQASGRGWGQRPRWRVALPVAAELGIGVAYFSKSNWDYVLSNCWTGNACTFFQLAPVAFLVLGSISLTILAANELLCQARRKCAAGRHADSVVLHGVRGARGRVSDGPTMAQHPSDSLAEAQ